MTKFEAAVIGAGPTGLAAALSLARMGAEVAVVAPLAGVRPLASNVDVEREGMREGSDPRLDQRTTALMSPSVNFLKNLGVLGSEAGVRRLACNVGVEREGTREGSDPRLTPITAVRIADDRGGLVRAPEVLFRASELGLDSFGANVANPLLLDGLREAARRQPRLAWVATAGVKRIEPTAGCARLELAEGGAVEARLAVAADGRNSIAPAAAGIAVRSWDYPQAAVVSSFGHGRPHDGIVNELHRNAGPLTTVPLPGRRSALVWVEAPAEARRLAALDDAAFAAVLEERLEGVLGAIDEVAPRAVHPLIGLRADRMTGHRIALVGEAAHVVPPIGAQGLNLGLRDAAVLADCVGEARAGGQDIGGPATLAAYERGRIGDVLARSVSIDVLNRSLVTDLVPVDMLRGLAAHLVAGFAPLRRALMQAGMGLTGPLPSLMRR